MLKVITISNSNKSIKLNQEYNKLPSELWYKIMSYLPFSQICRLGKVSRKFRILVTQHSIWKDIARRAGLLSRINNNSFYDTILNRYSKYICEFCGLYCARQFSSQVCLPIIMESYDSVVSLCRNCRVDYYQLHPEPDREVPKRKVIYPIVLEPMQYFVLPVYTAMVEYALTESELQQLPYAYHQSSGDLNLAPPVKHYIEQDVIDLARAVHGGDIGITRALMSSLNMFRPLSSLNSNMMDSGGSCSREYARKTLILYHAKSKGIKLDYNSITYHQYVLSGIGSVQATLDEMILKSTSHQ